MFGKKLSILLRFERNDLSKLANENDVQAKF